jgi:hypothetical protein
MFIFQIIIKFIQYKDNFYLNKKLYFDLKSTFIQICSILRNYE